MQDHLPTEQSSQIVHSLHAILKPFLLRRLKVDVEQSLPPKKEYVLYAPLSVRQSDVYDHVVKGGLRAFLIGEGAAKKAKHVDVDAPRKTRNNGKGKKGNKYDVDGDDDEYFEKLERGDADERRKEVKDVEEMGRDYQYKATCELAPSSSIVRAERSSCSEIGQQYEIAEHRDAIAKGLLPSVPI